MTKLKPIHAQILGATLVELLHGELSDETIAAVDSIKREDVPEPFNNLVGMMHGMTTYEPLRESIITSLIDEIRIAAIEATEKLTGQAVEWPLMNSIMEQVMQGGDYDIRGTIDMLAETDLDTASRIPDWTQPLMQHINSTTATGGELSLELLEVLEGIIQKRRAELIKENGGVFPTSETSGSS